VSAPTVDCAAVDFDLSPDQVALREAAVTLLDRFAGHDQLRARVGPGVVVGTLPGAGTAGEEDGNGAEKERVEPHGVEAQNDAGGGDPPRGFDATVWSAMADQGWLALEVPEDEGGLGLGTVEVAVLCEEVGRRLVAAPFLTSVLALGALTRPEARAVGGTEEWRDAISGGGAVGCLAFVPRDADLRVEGDGPRVLLTGTAGPTVFAPSADVAVIVTGSDVYAVDERELGRPPAVAAMDRTRELGVLSFAATPALHLGGAEAARATLDRAATLASAEMLGSADRVLSMAVEYAKDRVQFGKPIGSFQAVKHMLADALVDVEGMRSTAYYAAWCSAADDPDRSMSASMAKAWCSDASRRVMGTGLQVHGGIGFTWEHDMHLFLKRAQLDQVSYGDAAFHRDRIAGLLRSGLHIAEGDARAD
jgi:alkylation response protein AidB-like acyl-CoA dehydrogenase